MSSICISNCVQDARIPVRATYSNLYKWPESDAEFVKSVRRGGHGHHHHHHQQPRVVDSLSCRQMYLRSYKFSREEDVAEMTNYRLCFGGGKRKKKGKGKCVGLRKVKDVSCAAFFSIFHRLLSCTTTVDVVDAKN